MKAFRNGLITGLTLQLAIGPVFFFIINLALEKTLLDGFAGVLAVTLVDYLYISLAVLGIGKLLENKKFSKFFGTASSVLLIFFGAVILYGVFQGGSSYVKNDGGSNIISSFASVFLLTISSPMTIVFFTSLFSAKAIEYKLTKRDLIKFGMGTGFATFLFMGSSVVLFSLFKGIIPFTVVQVLNGIVGILLIGYGSLRIIKLHQR